MIETARVQPVSHQMTFTDPTTMMEHTFEFVITGVQASGPPSDLSAQQALTAMRQAFLSATDLQIHCRIVKHEAAFTYPR